MIGIIYRGKHGEFGFGDDKPSSYRLKTAHLDIAPADIRVGDLVIVQIERSDAAGTWRPEWQESEQLEVTARVWEQAEDSSKAELYVELAGPRR